MSAIQHPAPLRFHILGLPHTQTSKLWNNCAFSSKVLRLCAMLKNLGHHVIHYGNEGSDPECSENIGLMSAADLNAAYPRDLSKQVSFNPEDAFHLAWYIRATAEILKRHEPRDILLCSWGMGHAPIARNMPADMLIVEPGIGYVNTFAPYRCFESSAWMHWLYGREQREDGAWFDSVIPNHFDVNDFEFREKKEDYFLYLGRIVHRKGLDVAVETTRRIGARLIVAGQGAPFDPGENIDLRSEKHVEFFGPANVAQRRELMAGARALFAPTYYCEPFGGVTIEAALSGTPAVTTDWGVFPETILHGLTGYRCRTLEQFAWAAKNIDRIRPRDCRAWADTNFSMERVALQYQEYFEMLSTLWNGGWYEPRPDRRQLDWLRKIHPSRH